MGTYVYIGHDGPRGLELRGTVRERHLAHIENLDAAGRIAFAGPLRDESGSPFGSLVVFEADDLISARRVAESDPYLTEGVFDRVDVHESLMVFPKRS
ncbi:MAG: hypothetical protein JRG92_01450 [Deltaproteobacteria bacterium]|nr:hypothetical protein [Deltaproteobacteria bacterium]MBW2382262.1 hypothetical protein [Deltaproteobacteria bacterium]MBW2695559.1 hypothetical protein [Deltaproteobacteria bacterium]